jgi:hypothetical protein
MISRFAKPVPVLSMITTAVIDHVYEEHQHRICDWNRVLLEPRKLEQYAMAVSQKGVPWTTALDL